MDRLTEMEAFATVVDQGGFTDAAKKMMPRAVNWITGPSRSADIEQTLLMGAHGPRRLHILVVRG